MSNQITMDGVIKNTTNQQSKEEMSKCSFFEKLTQSAIWKAFEEVGRKRAEHALRFGCYY